MRNKTDKIGARIRDRRIELGMSQEEVSSRMGLAQTAVSKIERGFVDMPRNLDRWAKVLKTNVRYLIEGDGRIKEFSDEQVALFDKIAKLPDRDQKMIAVLVEQASKD